MDKISFNVFEQDNGFFDVQVFLNEEKLPHSIFNLFQVLASSQVEMAEFDLFTCTCGVSGCAGFHTPIKQSKTKNHVQWLFSEDYKVPKLFYSFDRKEFESTFANLKQTVSEFYNKGLNSYSSYEYYTDDVYEKEDKRFTIDEQIQHFVEYYNAISDGLKFCNQNMPFVKDITLQYDGYSASCSSSDLAFMILNEWPTSNNVNKFFYGRLLKTCQAINQWIINHDINEVVYLDNRSYNYEGHEEPKSRLNILSRFTFTKKENDEIIYLYMEEENMIINGVESPYPDDFSLEKITVSTSII